MRQIVRTELAPGIVSYENVMQESPAELIANIEKLVDNNQLAWAPAMHNDGHSDNSTRDASVRDVDVMSLPSFDKHPELRGTAGAWEVLSDKLDSIIYPVLADYKALYAAPISANNEGWQLLRYGPGHHFNAHYDANHIWHRVGSISFYLNDNFTGGEIEFTRFNLRVKPKENQAIVFPSNYPYMHEVHPVQTGLRYTVVGWFV